MQSTIKTDIGRRRAYYAMVRDSWAESFFFITAHPEKTPQAYADFRTTCGAIMSKLGLPRTDRGWTRAAQMCFVWLNSGDTRSDWRKYHNETPPLSL